MFLQMLDSPEAQSKFEILYHSYRALMLAVAYRILQSREDAEDAVHSAFVSIAENMEKTGDPSDPRTKAWIVTITENKAINLYRYRKRHPKLSLEEEAVGIPVTYTGDNVLARCLAALPAQYRQVLLLKYHYGYDNRELGKLLGISQANAIKRTQRAKAALEAICQKEGIR